MSGLDSLFMQCWDAQDPEADEEVRYRGALNEALALVSQTLIALAEETGLFRDNEGTFRAYSGRVDLTDEQVSTLRSLGIVA